MRVRMRCVKRKEDQEVSEEGEVNKISFSSLSQCFITSLCLEVLYIVFIISFFLLALLLL